MFRLRTLCLVAPLLGACSLVNAPAEIDPGTTGGGGNGGTAGMGGTAGEGGAMTTTTGETTTSVTDVCGDGEKAPAEECDDGNGISGDGCDSNCTPTGCGNNVTTNMEGCDDGNLTDGDGCDSNCTPTGCDNGIVTDGEECDDGGLTDPDPPPGNQDACNTACKLQEFDVQTGADGSGTVHERPAVGYRNDDGKPSFYALWHDGGDAKIYGREYTFDGLPVDVAQLDVATSPSPDPSGEVFCTAPSNRSVIAWRDSAEAKLFTRKVDSNGDITDQIGLNFPGSAESGISCGAADSNSFVVAAMAKGMGQLYDVLVQPFASSALPQGVPIDIGDAVAPNQTATWSIADGLLVAWIVDPMNNGPIAAQQLTETGQLQPGFIFQLSAMGDNAPREPSGARLGGASQFAFVYTRVSPPDMAGMTHREVMLRIFQSPAMGSAPVVVSTASADQREPTLAANPSNGKVVVVWTGPGVNGPEDVFFRVYNAMGMPQTDVLVANEVAAGEQTRPAVVADPPSGDVAILWESFVPNSVKPRKVAAKIFRGLLK
jgi:cysteine-rich repeat protein